MIGRLTEDAIGDAGEFEPGWNLTYQSPVNVFLSNGPVGGFVMLEVHLRNFGTLWYTLIHLGTGGKDW